MIFSSPSFLGVGPEGDHATPNLFRGEIRTPDEAILGPAPEILPQQIPTPGRGAGKHIPRHFNELCTGPASETARGVFVPA